MKNQKVTRCSKQNERYKNVLIAEHVPQQFRFKDPERLLGQICPESTFKGLMNDHGSRTEAIIENSSLPKGKR